MKTMTIAMITDDFLPTITGVGVHVKKMCLELISKGHRIIVITSRRQGQLRVESWGEVKVYRTFSVPVYGFYQALPSTRTLEKIFIEENVDIVHCHYLSLLLLKATKTAKTMGIPTVLTAHMHVGHLTQPVYLQPFRALLNRLITNSYGRFNDIIALSREHARQVESCNVSSRVHFISNPVVFKGNEADIDRPHDHYRVFFVGRLNPEKNVALLLRAFKGVLKEVPEAQLVIAGHGPLEKELRALASSLGIAASVNFVGHLPHEQMPDLYADCDVFVLPSFVEMQPLVALEAMRFKRPVIVTDRIISAKEIVEDGKNGYLVDADDPSDLARRLVQLWHDPDLRCKMGKAGFERSAAFTDSAVTYALQSVYTNMLDQPVADLASSRVRSIKNWRCPVCDHGTFTSRSEHSFIPSNCRRFQDEFFTVWRCSECHSLNSLPQVTLDPLTKGMPPSFMNRKVNPFNSLVFQNFSKWLGDKGVTPASRVLFYGVNAGMFRDFFRSKGYAKFDIFEEKLCPDHLTNVIENKYDAVIILDYLERCEHPRMAFKFAAQNLKHGGTLIVHALDADQIDLARARPHVFQQPYRLHIASWNALEHAAHGKGFHCVSREHRSYFDSMIPFINFRTFHEIPFFKDGLLDSSFDLDISCMLTKWWRIPRFIYLGLTGGIVRDKFNIMAVFTKTSV